MNKALLVLAMLGLGIPMMAGAAGAYSPGTVSINSTSSAMFGAYSVRFNTAAAAGSYIGAAKLFGGSVNIYGYDGARYFSCFVPPDSFLHGAALRTATGNNIGTSIVAIRNSTSNACTGLQIHKSSRYLD
jgi:hypothetical protein